MESERWRRLEELFHAAAPLDAEARAAYLRRACADDSRLAAEVARLLDANGRAERLLSGLLRPTEPE